MDKPDIVNKVITSIHIAEDDGAIKLTLSNGEIVYGITYGDCCSYTWIENVENPEAIIGSPVLSVVDLELPENSTATGTMESTKQKDTDCVQYYGVKIATLKGECVIDFRNDSNGYYGGELFWSNTYNGTEWKLLAKDY